MIWGITFALDEGLQHKVKRIETDQCVFTCLQIKRGITTQYG